MRAISHIAIGVRDLDKSIHFYRDLLGLELSLDIREEVGGGAAPGVMADTTRTRRRAAYLRFEEGPDASFIVLSQNDGTATGQPPKLDQVGIHHFSFWVDDLRERLAGLQARGVPVLLQPLESDTITYGEAAGRTILTCMVQDPDGIIIQFDQRLN